MEKITDLILLLAVFVHCTSSYRPMLYTIDARRINNQIHLENEASLFYQGYAHFFKSSNVSLPGFAKFFSAMSWKKKGHADKLITFMNKRLTKITFQNIEMEDVCRNHVRNSNPCEYVFFDTASCPYAICNNDLPRRAMDDALDLEKKTFDMYSELISEGTDPQMIHFLEYLDEQVDYIKEISDYVTQLRRFNSNPIGTFMMDERFRECRKIDLQRSCET